MNPDTQITEVARGLKITLSHEQTQAVKNYLSDNPDEDIAFAVYQGIDLKAIEYEKVHSTSQAYADLQPGVRIPEDVDKGVCVPLFDGQGISNPLE